MTATRLYEGMFLVDSALATADWEGTLAVVENILKRAEAEVVAIRKWGERKLAYDIDHKSRGTYILAYFKADGRRIAGIEKDVLLSEKIMRVLILGTEKRPPELIEADIKGLPRVEPVEGPSEAEESGPRRPRRELRPDREFEPAGRRGDRERDDAGQ
jgi:small subunit ribosomal protein S6